MHLIWLPPVGVFAALWHTHARPVGAQKCCQRRAARCTMLCEYVFRTYFNIFGGSRSARGIFDAVTQTLAHIRQRLLSAHRRHRQYILKRQHRTFYWFNGIDWCVCVCTRTNIHTLRLWERACVPMPMLRVQRIYDDVLFAHIRLLLLCDSFASSSVCLIFVAVCMALPLFFWNLCPSVFGYSIVQSQPVSSFMMLFIYFVRTAYFFFVFGK